jgi:pimeloyl-[acyl-carrier protein] methyl ester esterase
MSGAVWGAAAEELSASFRVTRVDLPGHGHSRYRPERGDLGSWAEALLEAAPAGAVWLGWSLGGLLAVEAALREPGRVRALALMATTPRFLRGPDWPCGLAPDTLSRFRAALADDPAATLRRFLALQVRGDEGARDLLRVLRRRLASAPAPVPAALAAGLRLLAETDHRRRLGALRMPTLWILGTRDTLVPWGASQALAALAPDARVVGIPGAAHAPFLSHRRAATGHLLAFLRAVA